MSSALTINHQAHRWITDLKESIGQLVRWPSRLWKFDFDVEHRMGRKNIVADVLSRLHSDHMDKSFLDEDIPECYVEHVEGTFLVDSMNSVGGDAPHKPTNDDFIY